MSNLDLIEAAVREINGAEEGAFVTLVDASNDDVWVQYLHSTINARYPFSVDPKQHLRNFAFTRIEEWTPDGYVWLELSLAERETALWIDRYFQEVLRCGADYRLIQTRDA